MSSGVVSFHTSTTSSSLEKSCQEWSLRVQTRSALHLNTLRTDKIENSGRSRACHRRPWNMRLEKVRFAGWPAERAGCDDRQARIVLDLAHPRVRPACQAIYSRARCAIPLLNSFLAVPINSTSDHVFFNFFCIIESVFTFPLNSITSNVHFQTLIHIFWFFIS